MRSAVTTTLQQRAIRQGVEYRFPFLDLDLVSFDSIYSRTLLASAVAF